MPAPGSAEPLQVDVRGLSLDDRRVALARALEELRSGRRVVLVTDRDPRPTLTTFRQMHQGEVDCAISPLAADLFRAELQLRRPGQQLTLAEHLRADHARIDGLLNEIQHSLRIGALAEADWHLAKLIEALSRHMAAEEELLFPAMQRMSEAVARAVPGMVAEHAELRALLPELAAAFARQDVLASEALLPQVRRSLTRHHEDEEHLVYPISDWALSRDEQERLIERLRGD
ncbi:MAG: hemerythrin domain-containing protein [Polyangia bacterium]|jgi:hemerythrin superfamily protein